MRAQTPDDMQLELLAMRAHTPEEMQLELFEIKCGGHASCACGLPSFPAR